MLGVGDNRKTKKKKMVLLLRSVLSITAKDNPEIVQQKAALTQLRQNLNNISEYETKIPGISEFFSNRMMNDDAAPLKRSSSQRVTSAAADATDTRSNLHAYHRAPEQTEYPKILLFQDSKIAGSMREAWCYYLDPYAGCGKYDIANIVCVKPRLQWANSMKCLEHHQVAVKYIILVGIFPIHSICPIPVHHTKDNRILNSAERKM